MVTGIALSPLTSCTVKEQHEKLKNWAGNLTYGTDNILRPSNTGEVQTMVSSSKHLRALGTPHLF